MSARLNEEFGSQTGLNPNNPVHAVNRWIDEKIFGIKPGPSIQEIVKARQEREAAAIKEAIEAVQEAQRAVDVYASASARNKVEAALKNEVREVAANLKVKYSTKKPHPGDLEMRNPDMVFFAHGDSTSRWRSATSIDFAEAGDFGRGFYAFQFDARGARAADQQALETIDPRNPGWPFVIIVGIDKRALESAGAKHICDVSWQNTVNDFRKGRRNELPFNVVHGAVGIVGNTGTWTQDPSLPDQYRFSLATRAHLKPIMVYPVDPKKIPSWSSTRMRYYEHLAAKEAASPSGKFSVRNIQEMAQGRAPKIRVEMRHRRTGQVITENMPLELHHRTLPQRLASTKQNEFWNLELVNAWAHEAMDEYRHVGWDLVKLINGPNSW